MKSLVTELQELNRQLHRLNLELQIQAILYYEFIT